MKPLSPKEAHEARLHLHTATRRSRAPQAPSERLFATVESVHADGSVDLYIDGHAPDLLTRKVPVRGSHSPAPGDAVVLSREKPAGTRVVIGKASA